MADSGFPKILESLEELIAQGAQLDQVRLDAPADLTITALQNVHTQALVLHTAVGNSKADFRTVALERQMEVDKLEPLAVQAIGQLAGRGASAETVEDARSYLRKLQGRSLKPKPVTDPASPNFDPTEKNISSSQQSNAFKISIFLELVDFLEAQTAYAGVKQTGLMGNDLRAVGTSAQTKHTASIAQAATLAADRNARNKFFFLDAGSVCDLAARYKNLVKGVFGAKSPEYKTINAISFKKPKP
jgi:hypothetical protein